MTGGLVIDWAGCSAITALLPAAEAQKRCCQWCHYIFRWFMIRSCPWIRVSPPPAEDVARLLDREKVCLLMNHTSFGDSVLFVGTTPSSIIWRYRTLMKKTLFDVSGESSSRAVVYGLYLVYYSCTGSKRLSGACCTTSFQAYRVSTCGVGLFFGLQNRQL